MVAVMEEGMRTGGQRGHGQLSLLGTNVRLDIAQDLPYDTVHRGLLILASEESAGREPLASSTETLFSSCAVSGTSPESGSATEW